jgi:hypothetical protein
MPCYSHDCAMCNHTSDFTVSVASLSRQCYIIILKGLSHEMDLAFGDTYGWLVLGLNRGHGQF